MGGIRHKIKLTGSLRQQTEGPSQSKNWEKRDAQRGGGEKLALQRRGTVLNFNLRILRLMWEGRSHKRGQKASAVLAILGNVLKISALHLKKKSQRQKFLLIPNSAPHPTSHLMAIRLYGCLVLGFREDARLSGWLASIKIVTHPDFKSS